MNRRTKPAPRIEPPEAEIQHVAYLLWLEGGQQPGHDLDNWLAAKELLRHRAPAVADAPAGRHLPLTPNLAGPALGPRSNP